MSRRDDLQKLIINYGRRLQKLQEQQALMGLDTPPHILIEIEDIQAKIAELQEKLATLAETDFAAGLSYPTPEQQAQSQIKPISKSSPQPPTQREIFVGRQAQLIELERHWQQAYHQQRGKVVFLVGEAGIGKTSLVREFSQSVLAKYPQMQYAEAQCDQIVGDISPYAPFVQLLNNLTEQATRRGKHWSVEFVREIGPDILSMVPVAGPILATAATSADFAWRQRQRTETDLDRLGQFGQQDIFQQFTDTFRNLARHKSPLLLFIDDWHWADTSSTNLLFHLARQLSDVPILLLATYRPHDAQARQRPILAVRTEMERYQLCASVSLDFLGHDDLIGYLALRFPQAQFESTFVEWLLDITNGNALFISEYVNLLLNEKLLTSDGRLVGDLDKVLPPANVEAVIRSRLGLLDQEARDMLAYGSVEGEQFTTLVLSCLLDLKPLPLLKRLRAIEETHQLITSLGQQSVYEQQTTVYRFIHTLIHRTLYNSLEAEEKTEINRLLLELRGQIYAQADAATQVRLAPELMIHAAEAGDYLASARYALAAAEKAAQHYAHAEVLKHCLIGLQALSRITDVKLEANTLQIDLLFRKADTEEFMGEWPQALETYHRVEPLTRASEDGKKLVRVLNKMGWVLQGLGKSKEALEFYQKALLEAEQLNNEDSLARVYNYMGAVNVDLGNHDQALEMHQKAAQIWEKLGDKARAASAYQWIGGFYRNQGEYEQALAWYNRARTINEELDNRKELGWNFNSIGSIYRRRKEYEQALAFYQQALTIWQELGYKRGEVITTNNIGLFYKEVGNYSQALEWFQKAITLNNKLGNKSGLAWNYRSIGSTYQDLGNQTRSLEFYRQALAISQEIGEKSGQAAVLYKIGSAYEVQADYREALNFFQQALVLQGEAGNPKDIAKTRQRIAEVEAKLAAQHETNQ